jgi:hypothetical protein
VFTGVILLFLCKNKGLERQHVLASLNSRIKSHKPFFANCSVEPRWSFFLSVQSSFWDFWCAMLHLFVLHGAVTLHLRLLHPDIQGHLPSSSVPDNSPTNSIIIPKYDRLFHLVLMSIGLNVTMQCKNRRQRVHLYSAVVRLIWLA